MNATAAKIVTGETSAVRTRATRLAGRDAAGEALVRGLRAIAQSASRAGWLLNAVVDAARGRYDR